MPDTGQKDRPPGTGPRSVPLVYSVSRSISFLLRFSFSVSHRHRISLGLSIALLLPGRVPGRSFRNAQSPASYLSIASGMPDKPRPDPDESKSRFQRGLDGRARIRPDRDGETKRDHTSHEKSTTLSISYSVSVPYAGATSTFAVRPAQSHIHIRSTPATSFPTVSRISPCLSIRCGGRPDVDGTPQNNMLDTIV